MTVQAREASQPAALQSRPGTPAGVPLAGFGTFWKGSQLSAFEAACLHSFVRQGHEITLFSYEPVANVPFGVRQRSAVEIASPQLIDAFHIDGKPSISHFSDYFRYRMFSRTELTWVDTDVMLLRGWHQDPGQTLLALETPGSICNAVMRLSSAEPWLAQLIANTEALAGKRMRWGETGPRLITKLVGGQALMSQASMPALYFPIHFNDFWKVFLPEHADACRAQCSGARTLHLWNNIVDRLGYWKDCLPPQGSYLQQLFSEIGAEAFFDRQFPLKNMRQLVENWHSRQTGQHLGIGNVVKQLLPSIGRTFRHYRG